MRLWKFVFNFFRSHLTGDMTKFREDFNQLQTSLVYNIENSIGNPSFQYLSSAPLRCCRNRSYLKKNQEKFLETFLENFEDNFNRNFNRKGAGDKQ